MKWWIVLLLVVALLSWLAWTSRPLRHRRKHRSDLKHFLWSLMEQMKDGGILIVRHDESSVFIQFAKYKDDKGAEYLHFGFPDARWSRGYFGSMIDAMKELPVHSRLVNVNEGDVRRFLEVDIKGEQRDVLEMGTAVGGVALDILGLGESKELTMWFEGGLEFEKYRKQAQTIWSRRRG